MAFEDFIALPVGVLFDVNFVFNRITFLRSFLLQVEDLLQGPKV